MRYVSTFSGVEAASVAWGPLGWEPMAFCEIEPFPCAVLAERFPEVPNLGDVSKVDWKGFVNENGRPDVLVGGSPCQSFSVAGKREGLDGASGLMWEFVRAAAELAPRWVVWENVPGALSSSGGEDFRCLLSSLDELGYCVSWRVLDAQFFGVAQRRRRVFAVGSLGNAGSVEVLFEPDCLRGDTQTSREKRRELAARPESRARCGGFGYKVSAGAGTIGYEEEVSPTLLAGRNDASVLLWEPMTQYGDVAGTLTARHDSSPCADRGQNVVFAIDRATTPKASEDLCHTLRYGGTNEAVAHLSSLSTKGETAYSIAGNVIGRSDGNGGNGTGFDEDVCYTLTTNDRHAVAFAQNTRDEVRLVNGDGDLAGCLSASPGMKQQTYVCVADRNANAAIDMDMCGTLKVGGDQPYIANEYVVRRLTPVECERLQGFPDGWTRIPWRGKPADLCPDGPRYKAMGNSMAVPVMRWIGERIARCESTS